MRDPYINRRPTYFSEIPFTSNTSNISNNNTFFNSIYNIYQFMKDYWYIGAIISGTIITGGALFYFWDPISSSVVFIGSTIKHTYQNVIQYFFSGGSGGDSGSSGTLEDYTDRVEKNFKIS